jgi:ribosomal protein S24E
VEVEVINAIENQLLGRREVECIFRGVSGALSRANAAKAVSKQMKVSDKIVYTILLKGAYGTRDAKGMFYIYNDDEAAKRDLPTYVLKRNSTPAVESTEAGSSEKPKEAQEAPKTE